MVEKRVYSLLAADAALVAVVPTARIKPPGNWQGIDRPWIEHRLVSQEPLYTHDGLADLTNWAYEISCIADDYQTARDVSLLVRSAMTSPGVVFSGQQELEDADQGVIQVVLAFNIWDSQ